MICGTVYDIWNVARKWRPAAVISLYSFNKLIINVTDLNRAIHVPSWRSRASPNRASTTCSFAVPVSGTLKFTAIWRPPKEDGRYVSFNFIHYLSLSRSVTCTFSSSGPFFFILFIKKIFFFFWLLIWCSSSKRGLAKLQVEPWSSRKRFNPITRAKSLRWSSKDRNR